ncbi:MAG: deoxyguanosinetriphosphate triphosphohydrolase [Deltaproteobacteria bacterium CG_4_10_14_0_2_um_filter_43_8]|nr:MAG: deoxyguanosinetriphosphate triphosphohydrolase [Deltaproteobacteria bacterium CG11_big_fil_rev_8_21_14_0_20_42_23]PJA20675.1 MAG: deoxyguanosinetriphosphate triphosphohydrolase [Deltaproteobacteria bacterium CG_4_10_14_0_2_um_filter_43_8]PJC64477.1 MAG: deoxyguanosinetriphosphate triphosphohydrolase [Deltaproteobacteria bacterium CG_4_9_14_0_2_um_filter_42_21]
MLSASEYEAREKKFLQSYAVKASETKGRIFEEEPPSFRSHFQRDRDRIIHCEAFRRLEYKTQVFANDEGDHYRTRLTHTLEVAQISRTIARTLGLNEDLAEAIALAHDLGHTPFGHRGEETLDALMKSHGGYEHNHQSYRIITKLERRYPEFDGLNLCYEVREGVAKHSGEYNKPNLSDFSDDGYPNLEAQVVDCADQIAYMNHDLDDGLQSQKISFDQLEEVSLWKDNFNAVKEKYPNAKPKLLKYQTIRRLITLLILDLQEEALRRIHEYKIKTVNDVRERGKNCIRFSPKQEKRNTELLQFLYAHFYRHPDIEKMAKRSDAVISGLYEVYLNNIELLPKSLCEKIKAEGKRERSVCDYIAGMTDRYALLQYKELIGVTL